MQPGGGLGSFGLHRVPGCQGGSCLSCMVDGVSVLRPSPLELLIVNLLFPLERLKSTDDLTETEAVA